jgi:hypothetical protein
LEDGDLSPHTKAATTAPQRGCFAQKGSANGIRYRTASGSERDQDATFSKNSVLPNQSSEVAKGDSLFRSLPLAVL